MANVEGKATAITVITPVKPWGPWLLRLVFWAGRNIKRTLEKVERLSFIHYAHWAVIRRFPDDGAGERLGHTYLLFESNFNGTWDQYIDAFSEVVPFRMKAIWGTSYGFPGPLPGGAVQAVHPQQRVRGQPLLVGLPRGHDHRNHLRRARAGGAGAAVRGVAGPRAPRRSLRRIGSSW